jgi:hypothetical protein
MTYTSALLLVFALGTAFAQTNATLPSKPHPKKKPAPSTVEKQIQVLRDLVSAQQQQLQTQNQQMDQLRVQLQQVLDATQQASAAAQKAQSSTDQVQAAAAQAQQSATAAQQTAEQASSSAGEAKAQLSLVDSQEKDQAKRVSALQDVLGRFRFSGDVRTRGEGFYQDGVVTRNRARVRVRFGLDGRLNEDFVGGFALATGSLGDPTTTNETLTNAFDRKTVGLDRGYITYNPVAAPWLSLTGGKFAYPWYRTSLTMDPDINPEGFNEKLSFDQHGPIAKNYTIQAFQLLYNENSKGDDSFGIGGQVSGSFAFGPFSTTPSFSLIDWRNPDVLLQAAAFTNQATSSGSPAIPISGEGPGCATGFGLPSVPPCAFAANGMTNATYTDAKGVPHFLSGFVYTDAILNNQLQTGARRFPLNLVLEYEDNLAASAHPLNSKGIALTSLGKQGQAYLGDFSIGQAKNRNDLQFGYSYWRVEQDAIIASWAESDQRAPTNILQQRFYAIWKLRSNTVAQYTLWFGHTLNTSLEHAVLATGVTPGAPEPTLKRQQFDLIYSF